MSSDFSPFPKTFYKKFPPLSGKEKTMPLWVEWIIGITTIIANGMVIGGIAVYLNNVPRKTKFSFADIQLGEPEKQDDNGYVKQKIRICFYNKTNTLFYINRFDIYDYEKKNENYSSIYINENGQNNPILDLCVQPNAPCHVDGYLILDYNRLLPERITLVGYTNKGRALPYNIHTGALVELKPNKLDKSHKPRHYWEKKNIE